MSDIGKRSSVNQHGSVLQRLDQIRLHSVFQQGGHGSHRLQIRCCHRFSSIVICHNNPCQTRLQILHVLSQTENGHDLTGNRDDKMILSHKSVQFAPQPCDNIAQHSVIHIHTALPHNLSAVDLQFISLLNMVVQKGSKKVVGGRNRMKIAGKMQVQLFHGHHLRIAASCGAAFDTEAGPQGGLPQRHHGLLPQTGESLSQSHAGGGLSLPCRSGIDGRHQHQLSVLFLLQAIQVFL